MLYQRCSLSPEVQLGIWQLSETLDDFRSLLPAAMVDEAERRFRAPHRQLEWLAVRALLFQLLGREAEVAYLPSGKPYLRACPSLSQQSPSLQSQASSFQSQASSFQSQASSLNISISHTRGYVAVILGPSTVGVDIEQYGPRVHKVAHKFMRPDEPVTVYEGNDTWCLLLHWSAKETLFKCIDSEEVDFRDHLRLFPFTIAKSGCFQAREYRTPQKRQFDIHYLLHPEFVLTYTY